MSTSKAVPYVLKPKYLSIVLGGKPHAFDNTHVMFNKLKKALKEKKWAQLPKLISVAENISDASGGVISVKNGKVFYKGRAIHSSLTARIIEMVKEDKKIAHMLKFMNNLYANPSEASINELYDWLDKCHLPITDDGCFVAYKAVNYNYKDTHTSTIDNHVGQVVQMPRSAVDADRRNECSYGLHFCSRTYLPNFHSNDGHIMKLKINPKDVVSIPADYNFSKGRCMRYEVIGEVGRNEIDKVQNISDISDFQTSVVEVKKSRQELLTAVLKSVTVKKAVRKRKMKISTIKNMSFGRLEKFAASLKIKSVKKQKQKLETITALGTSAVLESPLSDARQAAGITVGQMANELKINYKAVISLERKTAPGIQETDDYLEAIAKLTKVDNIRRTAISYPKAVAAFN